MGATISEEGSRPEIRRIAQATAVLSKLKIIWKDKNIALKTKIRLIPPLVLSICIHACESWTLIADLQRRIQAMEMRCFRRLLNINYTDHTTNEDVGSRIKLESGNTRNYFLRLRREI